MRVEFADPDQSKDPLLYLQMVAWYQGYGCDTWAPNGIRYGCCCDHDNCSVHPSWDEDE